ncbi:MAG: LysE family transporter [Kofleriaceae bacterium]|nr:LysE family transporter [Kofleriaceae bacterium]MCL4228059.1 LysE family transporter [Myxococcales bacterium]
MLTYFLIGVAIGALTGVPIGPVNVAVIDAAYRHTLRRGMAVGLGGAVGDFGFALAGILGVGPHVIAQPGVKPVLYLISGLVLVGYGLLTVRSQPPPPPTAPPHQVPPSQEVWSGFTVGFGLIVLNPAAIVTWVVVVGGHVGHNVQPLEGLAAATGVFFGSFGWFSFVAYVADKGKRLMGDKAIWIARVVGIALVGYGLYSLYRAAVFFRA